MDLERVKCLKLKSLLFITLCIMAVICSLWVEDAMAISGDSKFRYCTATTWGDVTNWTSAPIPIEFEPLGYESGYIYVININTGQALQRSYGSSVWNSIPSWVNVPLPTGYKPVSYTSSYIYIINPNTGETKYRYYTSSVWSLTGWISVPLPAGYEPLSYTSPYIYIINPNTGVTKNRNYNATTWNDLTGWENVPLPTGYAPLTCTGSHIYLYSITGAETTYIYNTSNNYSLYASGSADNDINCYSVSSYGGTLPNFPVNLNNIPEGVGIKNAYLTIYGKNDTSGVTVTFSNNYSDTVTQFVAGYWSSYSNINITNLMRSQFRNNVKNFGLGIYANQHFKIGTNSGEGYRGYSPQISLTYTTRPSSPIITSPVNQTYRSAIIPITINGTSPDSFQLRGVIEYKDINSSIWLPAGTTNYFSSGSIYTYNWNVSSINLTNINCVIRVKVEDTNGGFSQWTQSPQFSIDLRPTLTLTTADNQTFSNVNENLTLTGTVKDTLGETINIKYSIDDVVSHNNISIYQGTANGTEQSYSYSILINDTIPEGAQVLKVWAEDNYGAKSTEIIRNFIVNKTIADPAIRIVNSQGKAYNVNPSSGVFSDMTSSFIINNFGSEKPFYSKQYSLGLFGATQDFYDFASSVTYIGNNKLRVVTSENKAFDVDKDTGSFTDVTSRFINNNYGIGKPFFQRTYEQWFGGWGPFTFCDFGSTMAYIGNNIIRVVTSEGKAFDVDKDTGEYTEVTSTFLVNNFGTGKPFYLREYTHTIGGEAKTFYDWGSSMAYIGNNTLRVVTSEGKAFDVNVNDGSYTEITSTFLVNNFGSGKPFYHRQYPVGINGTNYTFHDWGCTMAYTATENPHLTITTTLDTAAFDTITLSGTVTDTGNNNTTISASIAGVQKSTIITNTSTAQEWTLTWDIDTDNIPDGSYSNIVASANNGVGSITTATYRGNINVYGAGSNITRDTVHYEYDSNGKLVRRYIINNP